MAIQFPRGTATKNDQFTGLSGEFSVDFTNELIRVHDGSTPGGAFSVGISSSGSSSDLSVNYSTSSVTVNNTGGTDAVINAATTSTAGSMSSADKTKLDGVSTGATSNSDDSYLLDRGNHTGTQSSGSISDFSQAVVTAVQTNGIDFGEL